MTEKSRLWMAVYGLKNVTNTSRNAANGRRARRPLQKNAGKKTNKNKGRPMRPHPLRNANQNQNHIVTVLLT